MHGFRTSIAAAGSLALASCGTAPELPPASPLAASPLLPALASSEIPGTPTEVYTRVARGAVTCWFGASGPLKAKYIYHAEAHPESKGGGAEITIFVRDRTGATSESGDPRSLKAFQIGIRPTGGTTEVGVEDFKIGEPLASRMKSDVRRWAEAKEGCSDSPITEGWATHDPRPGIRESARKSLRKKSAGN